jgi:hypothetical protein
MLSQAEMLRNSSRSSLPPPPIFEERVRTSLWHEFCRIFTFLIPDWLLTKVGKMQTPSIRQAWREKVSLCGIIVGCCMFLASVTYGINLFLCKGGDQVIFGKLKRSNYKDKIMEWKIRLICS